jgi:hypothetical protein
MITSTTVSNSFPYIRAPGCFCCSHLIGKDRSHLAAVYGQGVGRRTGHFFHDDKVNIVKGVAGLMVTRIPRCTGRSAKNRRLLVGLFDINASVQVADGDTNVVKRRVI